MNQKEKIREMVSTVYGKAIGSMLHVWAQSSMPKNRQKNEAMKSGCIYLISKMAKRENNGRRPS